MSGDNVRLVLLQFEIGLTHLEWNALFGQDEFLLHLAEFGLGFVDLRSRNAEVILPPDTQHWGGDIVVQRIEDEGVADFVAIARFGQLTEDAKEEDGIVVGFRHLHQRLKGFDTFTGLDKFRPELARVADVIGQRRHVTSESR